MAEPTGTADLIGRAGELQAVDRFLERATNGLASLLIDGEAGIGKTALWRASLLRAGSHGVRILRSAPAESERTLTLGGLTDLLADVGPRRPRAAARGPATRPGDRDSCVRRRTASCPTSGRCPWPRPPCFGAWPAATTLVLAIDDAQWLDDGSASILAYAIRRLVDRPVGVLLAVRGAPTERTLELVAGVPAGAARALHVGPMPLAALHQLFLGPLRPVVPATRARPDRGGVRRQSVLRPRDRPARSRGRRLRPRPASASPIPETLGALLEGRIAALPAATQAALLLAAVAVEPTLDTLRRADPRRPEPSTAAVAAGIASLAGRSIRFTHPLLAQAVTAMASPAELQACPRDPRPHRDIRRRASAPSRRRDGGSRGDRRRGARGRRGRRPPTRRDARRGLALRAGEPADARGHWRTT